MVVILRTIVMKMLQKLKHVVSMTVNSVMVIFVLVSYCFIFLVFYPIFPALVSPFLRQAEFLYFLLGMVFLYILPLVVITITYGGIILHLHRNKFATVMAKRGSLFKMTGRMSREYS